jgi:hypothetical protein
MPIYILIFLLSAFSLFANPFNKAIQKDSYRIATPAHGTYPWAGLQLSLADSIYFNTLQGQSHFNNTFATLIASGEFSPNLSFNSEVYVFTETTSRSFGLTDYQPFNGIPYNQQNSKKRTWDYFVGRTDYSSSVYSLAAGLDYIRTGPAKRNPLAWSGDHSPWRPWEDELKINRNAPVLFGGFQTRAGVVHYTQYSGQLFNDRDKSKYFHTHRLDVELPFRITLGLSENALYGSTVQSAIDNAAVPAETRDMQVLYAMPFIPYYFAEHYLGDRDNISMGFDIQIRQIKNWEFYAELLLDDMKSPLAFADDSWWGNKWALTQGFQFQKPVESLLFSFNGEFTRIEPWVYTHHLGAGHNYTNFGRSLGSNLGPNSRELYARAQIQKPEVYKLFASLSSVSKDLSKGSHISDIHLDGVDSDAKIYLNPSTTLHYLELGSGAEIIVNDYLNFSGGFYKYFRDYEGLRLFGKAEIHY